MLPMKRWVGDTLQGGVMGGVHVATRNEARVVHTPPLCCVHTQHAVLLFLLFPRVFRATCNPCQAVELFIDEHIGYLDITRVVEECCTAHRAELVAAPSLEEIVHYDQWARDWVAATVAAGRKTAVTA